ncbi:MAG: hypothetical protein EBX69_06290 [Betaproteobacteria bacterium]|nr:hypothetical protein [Betaproteobacteria bacterium]
MIWDILIFAVGVQLGLVVTLWRLGEQRQWINDEREYLAAWRDDLFRMQERIERDRRGGCGR